MVGRGLHLQKLTGGHRRIGGRRKRESQSQSLELATYRKQIRQTRTQAVSGLIPRSFLDHLQRSDQYWSENQYRQGYNYYFGCGLVLIFKVSLHKNYSLTRDKTALDQSHHNLA